MLQNAGAFKDIQATKDLQRDIKNGHYIVAHNMPFDLNMLRIHGIDIPKNQIIDSLSVARHVFKDGLVGLDDTTFYQDLEGTEPENHTLQYFRYLLEMDDQEYFKDAMDKAGLTEIKPHTALSDVAILWIFIAFIANKFDLTLEDMVRLTNTPVLQRKLTYGAKWKIRNMTYEEIIKANFKTPWGSNKKGYSDLLWTYENGPMSVDTEYSIIHTMAYGVLNGTIPYHKGKENYKQFLPLGVKYCFNEEEIKRALVFMGEKPTFLKKMWKNSSKKVKDQMDSPIDTSIDAEKFEKYISQRKNRAFLHNYAEMYRKEMVLNIK
jgi:hypothetical protein